MECEHNGTDTGTSKPLSSYVFLLMRITGGTTAILSVFGASLIIFTYAAFKNLRTTARQLLVNLSVADIIISLSHFVGLLAKYELMFPISNNFTDGTLSYTNPLCSAQGAFTAFGSVASFLWSMLIAVYMLVLTQSKTVKPRKIIVPIIYCVSWGTPTVIIVALAAMNFLGYNPNDSPLWCYAKQISGLSDVAQNILDYDLWLFLCYFLLFFLYALLFCCIQCPSCRHNRKPGIKAAKGDIKLLFVPLIFLLLRIWSSIIDVAVHYSSADFRNMFLCSDFFVALAILTIIGVNGQGLANAILFVGFTKKVRSCLWEATKSLCWRLRGEAGYCCSESKPVASRSDYDQLSDQSDEGFGESDTIVSGSGSKYGLEDNNLPVKTELQSHS